MQLANSEDNKAFQGNLNTLLLTQRANSNDGVYSELQCVTKRFPISILCYELQMVHVFSGVSLLNPLNTLTEKLQWDRQKHGIILQRNCRAFHKLPKDVNLCADFIRAHTGKLEMVQNEIIGAISGPKCWSSG